MKITIGRLKHFIKEASKNVVEDQKLRDELMSIYSDVSKEKMGRRWRGAGPLGSSKTWSELSVSELQKELDDLYDMPGQDDYDEVLPSEEEFRLQAPPSDDVRDGPVDPYEKLPMRQNMRQRHYHQTRYHGPNTQKK